MPRAVTNPNDTERYDLETLPEGFVTLRRLNYGESLKRRELSMKAHMAKGQDINFEILHQDLQVFDYQKCIVDHNLDDVDDRRLDFRNKEDILKVDVKVAQEIEMLIHKHNGRDEEEQDELGKSNSASGMPSMVDQSIHE